MSPSETFVVTGGLLCTLVIHFVRTGREHWTIKGLLLAVLAFFFWLLYQNRPPEVTVHVIWAAPVVGILFNLWGIMMVQLDKRVVASLLIGGLMIGLAVWAGTTAHATSATPPLPPKEQLTRPIVLIEPPPISRTFFYENAYGHGER